MLSTRGFRVGIDTYGEVAKVLVEFGEEFDEDIEKIRDFLRAVVVKDSHEQILFDRVFALYLGKLRGEAENGEENKGEDDEVELSSEEQELVSRKSKFIPAAIIEEVDEMTRERTGQPHKIPWELYKGAKTKDKRFYRGKELFGIAGRMRYWLEGDRQVFDVKRSVQATLKRGYPYLQFGRKQKRVEFLFLVKDEINENFLGKLFVDWLEALKWEDVYLATFVYRGDPQHLYRIGDHRGFRLDELGRRYGDAVLVLVGDGESLVKRQKTSLADWVEKGFQCWEKRAFLSTRRMGNWGPRETLIGRIFCVIPASVEGQLSLVSRVFGEGKRAGVIWVNRGLFETWGEIRLGEHLYSVEGLKQHVRDEVLWDWIRALAVYPEVNWTITLALGRLIEKEVGKQVLGFKRLYVLARLPWMNDEEWDGKLRLKLWKSLVKEKPEFSREVGRLLLKIVDELRAVLDVDAYALGELNAEWIVLDWRLRPHSKAAFWRVCYLESGVEIENYKEDKGQEYTSYIRRLSRKKIMEVDLQRTINLLLTRLRNTNFINQVLLYASTFNRMRQQRRIGLIDNLTYDKGIEKLNSDILLLMEELKDDSVKCREDQELNYTNWLREAIREKISNADLEGAIDLLLIHLRNTNFIDRVSLYAATFHRMRNEKFRGLIDDLTYLKGIEKLNSDILLLMKEVDDSMI